MATSRLTSTLRTMTQWPKRILEHRAYSEHFWAYTFLLPFLVVFAVFSLYTFVLGIVISFQDFTGFRADHPFTGFRNYAAALRDPITWHSLRVSAIYTLAVVPVGVLWPFLLAVIVQQLNPRLQGFFRGAFYLPGVTSGVVMTLIWVWIFYPLPGGLANGVLRLFGIAPQLWFGDAQLALPTLILMSWLGGWGGGILLYSAAMNGIPKSLYEAADLDCASTWGKFRHITWPLVKPTTLFLLVTGTIGSFQVFEAAYIATRGGPNLSTTTFVYHIWVTAFELLQLGKAAALSVILTVLVAIFAVIQFRFFASDVEY